jgi:hypothetical protein
LPEKILLNPVATKASDHILEEMHWEVLVHPAYSPYLALCNFTYSVYSKAVETKRFRANNEVVFCAMMTPPETINFFERGIIKLPE